MGGITKDTALGRLDGIFIIDKPAGISSAKVVAVVKAILGAKKVGHAGTLDPFATGVLICCVNRATKLARFFLHGRKTYLAVLKLGIATDTQDATGKVVSTCDQVDFSTEQIRAVFKKYTGVLKQQPPAYSALKHQGTPLYRLARKGTLVQKTPRTIEISSLRIIRVALPEIEFEVSCSAGTYIRTLCADMGATLGCGGHLKVLRRVESGGFTLKDAVDLPQFEKEAKEGTLQARRIGLSEALLHMQKCIADDALIKKIGHGAIINRGDLGGDEIAPKESFIKVVDRKNNLMAVLQIKNGNNRLKYCCVFPKLN